MSAPSRPVASTPTPEPPRAATEAMRAHYARSGVLPCIWCDRCGPCPCVVGEIEVRRARTAVTARHHASVARTRTTTRHRRAA